MSPLREYLDHVDALREEFERSYAIATKHYVDPPAWLVVLPLAYTRIVRDEIAHSPAIAALSGWLKIKFPSLAEATLDPQEAALKDSVLETVGLLTHKETTTWESGANSPKEPSSAPER